MAADSPLPVLHVQLDGTGTVVSAKLGTTLLTGPWKVEVTHGVGVHGMRVHGTHTLTLPVTVREHNPRSTRRWKRARKRLSG